MCAVALEDIPTKPLIRGFVLGAAVFFVFILVIALIAGADPLVAFLAALFGGLVAGGATGFVIGGRNASKEI